jgi:endoglucanase
MHSSNFFRRGLAAGAPCALFAIVLTVGCGSDDKNKSSDPLSADGGSHRSPDGGCIPTTCDELGATSGSFPDGCGGTVNCDGFVIDGGTFPGSDGGRVPGSDGGTHPVLPIDAGANVGHSDAGTVYAALPYRGLSMAGAEFAANYDGTFPTKTYGSMPGIYYYPTTDLKYGPAWPVTNGRQVETDLMDPYFIGKGMNTVRLPLRWERLQHSIASTSSAVMAPADVVATFDIKELAALQTTVTTLTSAGFTVLIDIHNYDMYTNSTEIAAGSKGDYVGTANVPNVAFENLWIGLASLYANDSNVVFDIMNEPNTPPDPAGMPKGYGWYLSAQAAVDGIRSIGANNPIFICGRNFADSSKFVAGDVSDPLKNIHDPQNNFAFEIHDYPDPGGGAGDTCTTASVNNAVAGLNTFLTWAKKYNVKGFLGEFSAGVTVKANSVCIDGITQMLTFLSNNSDTFIGWTYWSAGAGWGSAEPMNYPFFNSMKDSPQLTALAPFLK